MSFSYSPGIRVHTRNIERYRRLLATHLTEVERDYVKRRIAEERAAIRQLKRCARSPAPLEIRNTSPKSPPGRPTQPGSYPCPQAEHVAMNETKRDRFNLDELLHPARAFRQPSDVLDDPDLTTNEKRAILASWASDACAVEASPELRQPTDGPPVKFDDIMDALRALDKEAAARPDYGRFIDRARRVRELYRDRHGPEGGGLHG